MFSNESRKTWYAVYFIGCAALLFIGYLALPKTPLHAFMSICALFFASLGLWLSMPKMSANRSIGAIKNDIRKGKQAISSPLQKLCAVLGVTLVAMICAHLMV